MGSGGAPTLIPSWQDRLVDDGSHQGPKGFSGQRFELRVNCKSAGSHAFIPLNKRSNRVSKNSARGTGCGSYVMWVSGAKSL